MHMEAQGLNIACFDNSHCKADDILEMAGWFRALLYRLGRPATVLHV